MWAVFSGQVCLYPDTINYLHNYLKSYIRAKTELQCLVASQMSVSLNSQWPRSTLVNLSKDVFEPCTSTGSRHLSFLSGIFAQIFGQIVSNKKRLRNTNLVASIYFQMKNTSLPVGVRCSKTPLLKFRIKWPWISLEAAHSHREISTFCQSFQVYLVFQSCSHVGAKEVAVMKAGNKVL